MRIHIIISDDDDDNENENDNEDDSPAEDEPATSTTTTSTSSTSSTSTSTATTTTTTAATTTEADMTETVAMTTTETTTEPTTESTKETMTETSKETLTIPSSPLMATTELATSTTPTIQPSAPITAPTTPTTSTTSTTTTTPTSTTPNEEPTPPATQTPPPMEVIKPPKRKYTPRKKKAAAVPPPAASVPATPETAGDTSPTTMSIGTGSVDTPPPPSPSQTSTSSSKAYLATQIRNSSGLPATNLTNFTHRGRKRKKDDQVVDTDADIHLELKKNRERAEHLIKNPDLLLEAVKNIIFQFQQSHEFSFSAFKDIWKREAVLNDFFQVHPHQPDLIHILYYGAIGYTMVNQPVNCKSAIIYCLYLLYTCQIVSPPIPIDITLNIWDELIVYFNCFKLYELAEPYHAFKQLRNKNAFHFSASLHAMASTPVFRTNSTKTSAPIIPRELVGVNTLGGIDLTELNDVHNCYNQIKRGNNKVIPKSLDITKGDFYNEVFNLMEDNTVRRMEKMLYNRIPGLP
ncbi:hypothetical protein SAMD00019534_028570 [Acytostelium subglobosum LB1]|uniref:hypothetical protein n=1 Tax=Acytostelium subglobosum LB1 TaxID=1410327 RepID=UPI0006449AAE|nr:hypothetical protein SAMD00019534_028570 [Acytostelium subglobosum LB1]GAM19682.1 hypothetical protein SAMD00019534_028570 [Acytostelium subglobosum LB1]|eukprot:XP_012756444.1 hypothetical protein SAMD00019534_028570 [Acytostelium subglobosum LB1]